VKWVYKIKLGFEGAPQKLKVRVIAKGF